MEIRRGPGRWRDELPASPWRWLLAPAWCAYRPLVALRGLAYDRGWLPARRLPVPVLSVGNLAAGGTGKTPLTRHLARACLARGFRPAILSRGYRGDGQANDEAREVDECPVVCDPDRHAGGLRALAGGATCLILDDGFQHRRLQRDLDLVAIDATRPWGDAAGGPGAVLPLGYLREGRAALARAHALAITRADLVAPAELERLARRLAATGKPVLRVVDGPAELRPLAGGPAQPPGHLAGRPVLLASGLGNPLGFERSAARHGFAVGLSVRFGDHHAYTAADAALLAAEAQRRGAALVITGKDAVKLAPLLPAALEAWVLAARPQLVADDAPVLDRLLDALLVRR
jgi:tetraacyldisaccharide 4'-kinase